MRRKNLKADLTQKNFFYFSMLKRLENVFQGEKKIFLEKFFLEIFGNFDGEHQSGAASSCDPYTPKTVRAAYLVYFLCLKFTCIIFAKIAAVIMP